MKIFETKAALVAAHLKENQLVETKGYTTIGDAGAARYLIKTAAQAAADGDTIDGFGNHTLANTNVAILQVKTLVNVQQFGVVGDGVVDDSVAYQACLDYCGDQNLTAFIPTGTDIRVTVNTFIHGGASLLGESRKESKITIDADLALADGAEYAIPCGPRRKGDANGGVAWTGSIKNLKIIGTANADFQRCLFFFSGVDVSLVDCDFDFIAMPKGAAKGGNICESGNNVAWTPVLGDSLKRQHILIDNLYGEANQDTVAGGSEAVGLSLFDYITVSNCYFRGFADDQIAFHNCNHALAVGNRCFSTSGRLYVSNSIDVEYRDNYVERLQLADLSWINSWYAAADVESNSGPSCDNVRFINNEFYAPADADIAYWIRIQGAQNTTVEDNIFRNDSTSATTNLISVESTTGLGGSWGADSQVPADADGTARPRGITLAGNKVTGLVGDGKIQILGSDADAPGPFWLEKNVAGDYDVAQTGARILSDNCVFDGSGTGYLQIAAITVYEFESDFIFTDVDNGETTGAPHVLIGTGGSKGFTARRPGRVIGYEYNSNAAVTSGQVNNIRILKNATPVTTTTVNNAAGTHFLRSFTGVAGYDFVADDEFTIEMYGSSGQVVPTDGNIRLIVLYS